MINQFAYLNLNTGVISVSFEFSQLLTTPQPLNPLEFCKRTAIPLFSTIYHVITNRVEELFFKVLIL